MCLERMQSSLARAAWCMPCRSLCRCWTFSAVRQFVERSENKRASREVLLKICCGNGSAQSVRWHRKPGYVYTAVILRIRYSLAVCLVYKRPSLVLLFSLHAGIASARRPRHGSRINYSVLAEQKKYNIVVSVTLCAWWHINTVIYYFILTSFNRTPEGGIYCCIP